MILFRKYKLLLVVSMLVLLVLACGSSDQSASQDDDSKGVKATEAPLSEPTAIPISVDLPDPEPAAGKGNLSGQVRWNDIGAAGIELKICTEFSWFGGCEGKIYSTTTDEGGIYIFKDIDPGEYALTLRVFDTDSWLYMTTGLMSEEMYTIDAGETTKVGVSDIFKVDLKALEPTDDSQVQDVRPVLKWEAYEGASTYEVWLNPDKGDAIASSIKVDINEYTPGKELFNCEYTWSVEAFNDNGTKITETEDYLHFTITGARYECIIQMIKPLSNDTVAASGIEMEWEAHPLASVYKLYMYPEGDSSNHVLDFLEVRENRYTIPETLSPGKYILSIYAYDSHGDTIAGSNITYIIVQ
ncbi:MAG: hypothetical protein JW704_06375 [Anaerolineaceae bacterium]|nr:hypothetical protein [Anaerolineaceae bacterium]MBN2678496.1 hypothetical protein [Anaerolineaceae bacterium]